MRIEKRGNKWRIQPTVNGKRHSITFDHKPTQKEIADIVYELQETVDGKSTFQTAALGMIKDKSNVLSPSTIRGYHQILKALTDEFKAITIIEMTSNDIQREINYHATRLSPKSIQNYYGLISVVFAYYRPLAHFKVKLPQKQVKTEYCPTQQDVRMILEDCATNGYGEKYIFPIMLGCYGMRTSEIIALTDEDIDTVRNQITINKSKVINSDSEYVVKPTPKTNKSNRVIQVSEQCIEAYTRYGLYNGYPKRINQYLTSREKALGLEHFSFHKLRHYFASLSIDNGIPLSTIQEYGGWSSPRTLQKIYQHNMRDFSEISDAISLSFGANCDTI